MDDKTQKERLEQELRFLKESFEAEVISKEEYEKGKERIERKLKELQAFVKTSNEEKVIETQNQQEEKKIDKAIEIKEEEKIKLKVMQDEPEPIQIQKIEQKEPLKEPTTKTPKTIIYEQKKENKFLKYTVVFIVLALIVFFSYSLLKNKKGTNQDKSTQVSFVAACYSDDNCKQEGKMGSCLSPGTKDAKCEFKDIPKINVIVLNDRKNCFNCDTQRVLDILKNWFDAVDAQEIDYNTDEGKKIADEYNAVLLPLYILDKEVAEKPSFEEFKQVFFEKNDGYILKEDAAGSSFYFKRESIPNKVDFFVKEGDSSSIKAENNLEEFLNAFEEVKFEKHLADDGLAQELNIKTFPTFLINNRIRFGGVLTAETIKENFCKLNKAEACEENLSKSLV